MRQSDLQADASLAELNRTLYSTERAFRHEAGLPRRDWFKHLAYAPGFYTGYGVKTLPGIREAHRAEAVGRGAPVRADRAAAVDRLRSDVEKATSLVARLPGRTQSGPRPAAGARRYHCLNVRLKRPGPGALRRGAGQQPRHAVEAQA